MNLNVTYYRLLGSASVVETLLPALSVLLGLQVLRVLIPQMAWLLGDRFGLNAVMLGIIALAIFSFSFLAGFLKRIGGSRKIIVYTASGLGLARLLIQIQWQDPLAGLCLAVIGTVLFGIFLAVYTDSVRQYGNSAGNLVAGLLTGLILDTALNGVFGTYDLAWNSAVIPLLIVIILVLLQWQVVTAWNTAAGQNTDAASETGGRTCQWLAIGPFLFLQMVVLQNMPRLAVSTGWHIPFAFGWLLLAQIAGLFAAVWLVRNERLKLLPVALITGVLLVVLTLFPYPEPPWLAAVLVFAEQITVSLLITVIILNTRDSGLRFRGITVPNGAGILLLGILTLGYYTVYQISLPYTNTILETVAAAIIALCALIPCLKSPDRTHIAISITAPVLTLILLIMPLAGILSWREPEPVEGNGLPVKFMTYNLHNGFNTKGDLDLEALAQVIEENDPDIVVLQEISRGWLVSGRVDMLTWLSQRLDMPYVSGPTADPLWGNAILSRYPVIESVNREIPPRDLFILRGYLLAKVDTGNGNILNIIATHLHHLGEDSEIRQEQVPVILTAWNGMTETIIAGDMNAEPDSPEIGLFRQAGLIDVMAAVGVNEGYTFNSADLYQRIDYIWISPDLKSGNAGAAQSRASDHLPVIVEIFR